METRRRHNVDFLSRQHAELSRGLRRAENDFANASFDRDEVLRNIRLEGIYPEFRAADAAYRQAHETRNVLRMAVRTASEKLRKAEQN